MKKILLRVINLAAALSIIAFSNTASAQLGSLSTDLVFTPVTPCRIMDTRKPGSLSGAIAAGATRDFYAWVGASFAIQGGDPVTCNLLQSSNLAAVVVNFTVVDQGTGGYITAYPYNAASRPVAATVNFAAGAVVGNNATLKINQTGSGYDFKIFSTSNVHVIADIVGYYSKPVATALQCVDTANTVVSVSASGGTANATAPACAAGYTQTATNCETTSWLMPIVYSHSGTCSARNGESTAQDLLASRTCCRIPGR